MPPANTNCLKCDKNWYRTPEAPPEPCPGCGDREWDHEFPLENFVGAGNDYYVTGERVDGGLILTIELRMANVRSGATHAPLAHRLKSYYRHAKGDLQAKDGRELMVSFDRDREGLWQMRIRRQHPWEARRLVTDVCRRHRWAIDVYLGAATPNTFADREHCTCPSEPPCEVCVVAANFAEARRQPGSDGTAYWTELNHAVMRDLGKMS